MAPQLPARCTGSLAVFAFGCLRSPACLTVCTYKTPNTKILNCKGRYAASTYLVEDRLHTTQPHLFCRLPQWQVQCHASVLPITPLHQHCLHSAEL